MKMGIGPLGNSGLILKRKFRYTLSISWEGGEDIPQWYVKIAARPQLEIDEVEINFLNGVDWVPGKGRWQPITITYIDAHTSELSPLYQWIAAVYDFTQQSPQDHLPQSERPGYKGLATLKMFDGCGTELERWELNNCWPQSVNFGDLDYSSSEEATIELTMRYSQVKYTSMCDVLPLTPKCVGCKPFDPHDPGGELGL